MAKVFWFGGLIVEYHIQVDALGLRVTLILIALGYLERYAGLCFCIFCYPLLYQRAGKSRCLDGAYAAGCGVTLCPGVAQSHAQY